MGFWKAWARLFARGDSWRGLVGRIIAAIIVAGIAPTLPMVSISLARPHAKPMFEAVLPLGFVVSAAVVALWGAMTGSIAWTFARAPRLRTATTLETDVAARTFRLRLWNDASVRCRPRVVVTNARDDQGNVLLNPAQVPLELQWTHQPQGLRSELGKEDTYGEVVAVCRVDPPPPNSPASTPALVLFGALHQPSLGGTARLAGRTIDIELAITSPEHPEVRRIVRHVFLKEDNTAQLGFSAV